MLRFEYLSPSPDAVIEGFEDYEKIYALDQPEYTPIRTLVGEGGNSAIYRCALTADQRKMIAEGADVLVEIIHFGMPLAPSRVMLLNQTNLDAIERRCLPDFLTAQLNIKK